MTDRPRDLAVWPCQSACSWSQTGEQLGGETLYGCAACGSEWVRSEQWTPIDWQGLVPEAVREERASAPSTPTTTSRPGRRRDGRDGVAHP